MARKPLIGTVANNVLEWGVGGINIDGCRIGNEVRTTPIHSADTKEDNTLFGLHATIQHQRVETTEGRFPANLIMSEEGEEEWRKYFYCPKASKKDRDENNIHPTVKPTDLMGYLIRLVTPKGGVVLDPFTGSGSTGKAAVREGMQFIGIEREEEYFEIAKQRIEWEVKQKPNTTFWD
jgi:site-specific DNA-methyltransferase (adenine-specific)